MQIQSLTVEHFAGLPEQTLSFGAGLNLAQAPNEGGKSRICAFIRFMFYGFSDKADRERYLPFGEDTACGTLTLTDDAGIPFRIERSVGRTGRGTVKVLQLPEGTELPKQPEPWERFLHLPEEVFVRSAFVGQTDALQASDRGGGEKIRLAIDNLLAAGDAHTDPDRALKKLEALRVALRHKRGGGGRLWELEQALAEGEAALVRAHAQKEERTRLEAACIAAEEQVRRCSGTVAELEARLRFFEEGERRKAYEKVAAYEAALAQAKDTEAELHRQYAALGKLPTEEALTLLRDQLSQARFAKEAWERQTDSHRQWEAQSEEQAKVEAAEAAALTEEVSALQAAASEAVTPPFAPARFVVLPWLWIGLLLFCGTIAAGTLLSSWILAVGGGTVGALCVGISFAVARRRARAEARDAEIRRQNEAAEQKAARLRALSMARAVREQEKLRREGELAAAEAACRAAEQAASRQLAEFGESDPTALPRLTQRVHALREAARAVSAAETAWESAGRMLSYDPATARRLADTPFDTAAWEAELARGESAAEFRKKLADAGKDLQAATAEREQARLALTECKAGATDAATEEGRLCEMRASHTTLTRLYEACLRATDALDTAKRELRCNLAPRLSEEAGALFSKVTAGRHTTLTVQSELTMTYTEPQTHAVDTLSAGTQDAAYISLRLALLRVLGQTKLPVFFDESFARMDDRRLSALLELLCQEAAGGTQIFLFTNQAREGQLLRPLASVTEISLCG